MANLKKTMKKKNGKGGSLVPSNNLFVAPNASWPFDYVKMAEIVSPPKVSGTVADAVNTVFGVQGQVGGRKKKVGRKQKGGSTCTYEFGFADAIGNRPTVVGSCAQTMNQAAAPGSVSALPPAKMEGGGKKKRSKSRSRSASRCKSQCKSRSSSKCRAVCRK